MCVSVCVCVFVCVCLSLCVFLCVCVVLFRLCVYYIFAVDRQKIAVKTAGHVKFIVLESSEPLQLLSL